MKDDLPNKLVVHHHHCT